MRQLEYIVTFSHAHNINYRIRDFCHANKLINVNMAFRTAEHPVTGDVYRFYLIKNLDDAFKLGGFIVHSYIHLDPLPVLGGRKGERDLELQSFLMNRIRRPL